MIRVELHTKICLPVSSFSCIWSRNWWHFIETAKRVFDGIILHRHLLLQMCLCSLDLHFISLVLSSVSLLPFFFSCSSRQRHSWILTDDFITPLNCSHSQKHLVSLTWPSQTNFITSTTQRVKDKSVWSQQTNRHTNTHLLFHVSSATKMYYSEQIPRPNLRVMKTFVLDSIRIKNKYQTRNRLPTSNDQKRVWNESTGNTQHLATIALK